MRRPLAGLAALVSVLALGAAPAAAADEIGLSPDGITFASQLPGPLFDDQVRWVPGDVRTATFFVRNQGGSAGDLAIDVLGAQPSRLIDTGDLVVSAQAAGVTTAVADGAQHRMVVLTDVPDGDVVPVTVTVAFDPQSANTTQLLASTLSFRVALMQATSVVDGGSGSNDSGRGSGTGDDDSRDDGDGGRDDAGAGNGGPGLLPDTGSPLTWSLLALALGLLAGGTLLITVKNPSRQDAHHD